MFESILEEWVIKYNPKPIPTAAYDWEGVHKDYDGAPSDSFGPPADDRFFTGGSPASVESQILDYVFSGECK